MRSARTAVFITAASFAALIASSCGASNSSFTNRQLLSISLTPATSNGSAPVQFTATGHYNNEPYTQTPPQSVHWGACYNNAPTTAITVTQQGVAQCSTDAPAGTYSVWADAPPSVNGPICLALTACGGGCFVVGTAELVCGK